MRHHFTRYAAATCTIVLLAGACTEITQPPANRGALDPNFSHKGRSETMCTFPDNIITGTHDNVTVPPGQSCFIIGATVLGDVKALEGSQPTIHLSAVHGNVEGDRPGWVQISHSSTVGNVFITGAGVSPPDLQGAFTILMHSTVIGGDVHILKSEANTISIHNVTVQNGSMEVEDNSVLLDLIIQNNLVAEKLQVSMNKGPADKSVTANTVGANLQCFKNDEPFEGRGNAARKAQGQCSTDPLPAGS